MNIIFLDIDGVVICTPQYAFDPMCSWERTHFNTNAIGWLKILLKHIPDCRIVLNTTHNKQFDGVEDIKIILIRQGIPFDAFHKDDRTRYPYIARDLAVKEWLASHKNYIDEWIAFDDCDFTEEENLILLDPDDGIDRKAFEKALSHFGITDKFLIGF